MYYILINLISFKNNGNMNKSHVDPNASLLVALKDSVKGNRQNGKKKYFEWYIQSSPSCERDVLTYGSTLIDGRSWEGSKGLRTRIED